MGSPLRVAYTPTSVVGDACGPHRPAPRPIHRRVTGRAIRRILMSTTWDLDVNPLSGDVNPWRGQLVPGDTAAGGHCCRGTLRLGTPAPVPVPWHLRVRRDPPYRRTHFCALTSVRSRPPVSRRPCRPAPADTPWPATRRTAARPAAA